MRRKQLLLFSLILLCLPAYSYGQLWSGVLDPLRAIDWTQAGAGTIPNRTTICSTLTSSATAATINSAIATCPSGQVVFLSSGDRKTSELQSLAYLVCRLLLEKKKQTAELLHRLTAT